MQQSMMQDFNNNSFMEMAMKTALLVSYHINYFCFTTYCVSCGPPLQLQAS